MYHTVVGLLMICRSNWSLVQAISYQQLFGLRHALTARYMVHYRFRRMTNSRMTAVALDGRTESMHDSLYSIGRYGGVGWMEEERVY